MNLSTNCTNRCLSIAKALQKTYTVAIVGTTFGVGTNWGKGLWPPLQNIDIPIYEVPGDHWLGYLSSIRRLLHLIDTDLIIACKPRLPSYGIALLKHLLSGTPIILDVDDDELAMTLPGKNFSLLRRLRHPNGYDTARLMHLFRGYADGVFCVSEFFRQRYGGVIVPHGQDWEKLNPAHYDRTVIRQKLGIKPEQVIIGFIGTPHPSKGVDLILEAMAYLQPSSPLKLMIVGAQPDDSFINSLQQRYPGQMLLFPMQPLEQAPLFLAASDLVILPQRNHPDSYGQMPAKLTDAMAMAKSIIASRISDIPKYLDNCGLLVEPNNVIDLAEKIRWVLDHRESALAMGNRARQRFIQDLSLEAMARVMIPEIERILDKQKTN